MVMWLVALGAQFLRMTSATGNLSAAHTDVIVNLLSRAILIPAVALSIVLVRLREGLSLRTAPSVPPPPTGFPPPSGSESFPG
jgi:hypothetical protein